MLAKILKGSKDKKLLSYKLDTCPSYGAFQEMTLNKIMEYIDFTIQKGYLEIAYNAKLPMLVYTEQGWSIEKETYAEELLENILSNSKKEDILELMHTTNREVKLLMLEKIATSKNNAYITFLEMWKTNEVKKMKSAIQKTLNTIK